MATSPAFFSSPPSLPINGSSTKNPSPPSFLSPRLLSSSFSFRKSTCPVKATSDATTILHDVAVASSSSSGASTVLSSSGDGKTVEAEVEGRIGARVRVKVPLKVYHVPKVPEFELSGKIGVLKDYVGVWKGKRVSSNLPYKVQFVEEIDDRSVKFFAHLKEDEFEYI